MSIACIPMDWPQPKIKPIARIAAVPRLARDEGYETLVASAADCGEHRGVAWANFRVRRAQMNAASDLAELEQRDGL